MALHVPSSLVFKANRCPPELVAPAVPTPRELKFLSDLDDQGALRSHFSMIFFYRYKASMAGKDPVEIIRQALAKLLVFYYPFAGRLREAPNGKLMVDCTGEGVLFIEADADVTLDQFGKDLMPPFPCMDELIYNVPDSDQMINCPLLCIQVTRLKCGGFIIIIRQNHTMGDAQGNCQFMKGLAEIACGASKPSILPVWHREMLCARDPPRITCIHNEFNQPLEKESTSTLHSRSFFFGPNEIATIRHLLPPHHAQSSTSSEVLSAFIWRCHTIALQWEPNEEVRFLYIVNARYGLCKSNLSLPNGYYGNTIVSPAVVTTVGELCNQPLGYALELVKKARNVATEEYVRSVIDLLVINGRPTYFSTRAMSLEVSDITNVGYKDVDFGWGKAMYAGVPHSYYFKSAIFNPYTNSQGEQGRAVLICLPTEAMERFMKELDNLLKIKNNLITLKSNL